MTESLFELEIESQAGVTAGNSESAAQTSLARVTPPGGGLTPQARARARVASRSERITDEFLRLSLETDPDQSDGWQFRAFARDHTAGSPVLAKAIEAVDGKVWPWV